MLEAFEAVKIPGKELLFVGDGKLKPVLEAFVRKRDINSVRFLGFQRRLAVGKYYAIADALVLPSSREATGAVITEAMSFGLPVIVSDKVGFGMDLVEHGSNGFIFPVGDTAALAGYITQLMEAPIEARKQMGKRSRKLAEEWAKLDLAKSVLDHVDLVHSKNGADEG
jgi:glycosyltransferase involved in cell wall biosynthesis